MGPGATLLAELSPWHGPPAPRHTDGAEKVQRQGCSQSCTVSGKSSIWKGSWKHGIMGKPLGSSFNQSTNSRPVSSAALSNRYGCFLFSRMKDPQIHNSPSQPGIPPLQNLPLCFQGYFIFHTALLSYNLSFLLMNTLWERMT